MRRATSRVFRRQFVPCLTRVTSTIKAGTQQSMPKIFSHTCTLLVAVSSNGGASLCKDCPHATDLFKFKATVKSIRWLSIVALLRSMSSLDSKTAFTLKICVSQLVSEEWFYVLFLRNLTNNLKSSSRNAGTCFAAQQNTWKGINRIILKTNTKILAHEYRNVHLKHSWLGLQSSTLPRRQSCD